ncbi:Amidophosphoribosyltransferase [Venturia nashicola]|nr:Amidophosphoribosyltransferase [Venturia nashicola]
MPPKGSRPGPVVQDPNKPPQKKRGPKPKAPTVKVRTTPVLKNSVFRSREKKLAVLTWIVQTRYPCAPLHPGRAGLATDFGWRSPTDQEAADFFKIPATTINSWWRNRDVIMNQPKGSRIVRPRKKKDDDDAGAGQTKREASDESEMATPGLESSGMDADEAIDLTEETPAPEASTPTPTKPPQPSFLSTLNTVVNFHTEAPPPRQNTWRHKAREKNAQAVAVPALPSIPTPVLRAPSPIINRPLPQSPALQVSATPANLVRGIRTHHINTLTAPPPRQSIPVGPPPPHRTENVRVVYPEPPPAATIDHIDHDLPRSRGPEIPSPVIPQYPSFPTF